MQVKNQLLDAIYSGRMAQATGCYRGKAKQTLAVGIPSPFYSFLGKARDMAFPAGVKCNEYAALVAWIGAWDQVSMAVRQHVCPKPDSLAVTGREALGKFLGTPVKFANLRPCGSEFCPMCTLRRIEALDEITNPEVHNKALYGYYHRSYGEFAQYSAEPTNYTVCLSGMLTSIQPVYGMKRIEYLGGDSWSKADNIWVRKYATVKDTKPLMRKFCKYTAVPEEAWATAKYAMYDGVLPSVELIAMLLCSSGSVENRWAVSLAGAHNTRKAFRVFQENKPTVLTNAGTTPVRVP